MTIGTRFFPLVRYAVVASLITPYCLASAQQVGFEGLLKGEMAPLTMKPADLPANYMAVKTTMSSAADLIGVSTSMLPFLLMGGQGGSSNERLGLLKAIGVCWTDGRTVELSGGRFLVTYRIDFDLADLAKTPAGSDLAAMPNAQLKLTLLRVDGIQSISPEPSYSKAEFLAALQGNQAPVGGREVPGGPLNGQQQALSNGKQIGLGLIMYTTDYDDQIPYVQSTKSLQRIVSPYIKNDALWNDPNPNGARFLFNMNLAGVAQTAIPSPAETPMVYEDKPWPDGRRVVVYCDGHAKLIAADAWPAVEKALAQKLPRVGKPLPANYPSR